MYWIKNLKKPENIWLLIILVVAAALRFYHYGTFSYSNDELSALNRLQFNTFRELVNEGFYIDGHPGGIQTFLWFWVRMFGDNEWVVRLPFVLMGIAAVWMSYKVAKFMFGTSSGLFTAAAITFLQFPLLYSQIARPYGSGMLFCLMLVFFWLRIFFTENGEPNLLKPKLAHIAGFAISAALCMYNHYFSFLFALIVGFSGFFVAQKNNIFYYIVAALIAALLFVPHIPITLNHLTYKGVGLWLGVPDKTWIFSHLFFIFDQSIYILILFIITLVTNIALNKELKTNHVFKILLASWFLLPIAIGYVYSVKVNPVLQHSVLIFSFPYFIILLFSNTDTSFGIKRRILLAVFLVAGVLGTTFVNGFYKQQHFGEFKDIARLTVKWETEYKSDSITKVININSPYYIDYYLNKYHSTTKFDQYQINGAEGLQALSEIVLKSHNPYFLYAVTKPSPTEAEDIIRSTFPYVIEQRTYDEYSAVILFGKYIGQSFEKAKQYTPLKELKADITEYTSTTNITFDSTQAYQMNQAIEYSPGIEVSMNELSLDKELFISVETDLFSTDSIGEAALVLSIETIDSQSILWKGALAKYVKIPGKWCKVINTLNVPSVLPKGAKLKVYFWNKDKRVLYLRNLRCTVYSKN